jgi:serine/threonine protein kinase/WD40 repeat protein
MNTPPSANSPGSLSNIIAQYLQAVEKGEAPDREALLAAHPQLAEALQAFFSDHDRMRQIVDSPTILPSDVFEAPTGASLKEPPSPGTKIRYLGDYELLEEIARGGMGIVYKARQISLNRTVALKMILSGQLASPEDVQRFRTEAEAAANLDHPHIVPIYEVGEHEGQHYFSMKLIEGGSLSQEKEKHKPLGTKQQQRWAAQLVAMVARAVHHAHQRGILHRDLKPGNILLDAHCLPHVTDFGLAKKVEGGSEMTHTGVIVGTPSYMAPEQARSNKMLTTAVDVYSLGAILYELLIGQPPFKAATPLDTILEVLEKEPVKPRSIVPAIDQDLETIVLKCLEKDSSRRYGSSEALAEELERWVKGEPILARSVGRLERSWRWCRRNPVSAGLTASFLLALASGIITSSIFAVVASNRADAESVARQDESQQRQKAQKALKETEASLYANSTNLAYQYWNHNKLADEERILDQCPTDLRHWEWNYLHRLNHCELFTWSGNSRYASSFSFNRDGTRMLVGFHEANLTETPGIAKVWDTSTCRVLTEIQTPEWIRCGAISPDGKTVVLCQNTLVTLFDATSGNKLYEFAKKKEPAPERPTPSVAFSSNGTLLAVQDAVRDVPNQRQVWQQNEMIALAFNPNGKQLLYATEKDSWIKPLITGHYVHLMDTSTWKKTFTLGEATNYCFSEDGRLLALQNRLKAIGDTQPLHIIETETGRDLATIPLQRLLNQSEIRYFREDLALAPDGTHLAVVDPEEGTTIQIWNVPKRQLLRSLKGHTDTVLCLRFTPDGQRLVSSSKDKTIKFWNPFAEQSFVLLPYKLPASIYKAVFSCDAKQLALVQAPAPIGEIFGSSGKVIVWDITTGRKVFDLGPASFPGFVLDITFSKDGNFVATRSDGGGVQVWHVKSGKLVSQFYRQALSVALSPDGLWTAASLQDGPSDVVPGTVMIWNNQTAKEHLTLISHDESVKTLAFSQDGKTLATASNRKIKLWETTTGLQIRTVNGPQAEPVAPSFFSNPSEYLKIDFSPDGTNLIASNNEDVWLIDALTGTKKNVLRGYGQLAMTLDGQRFAGVYGRRIRELKFWDTASGQELLTLPLTMCQDEFFDLGKFLFSLPFRDVVALSFTPDGSRLYAVLRDGTILYWDASPTSQQPIPLVLQK